MRAARIFDDLSLRLDEVAVPVPGPGQVLVRIRAAGVCGTDLHILDGMIKPDPYPMTPGHEAAGLGEMAGDGSSMSSGDPAAADNKMFCGWGNQFLAGRPNAGATSPGQLGLTIDRVVA